MQNVFIPYDELKIDFDEKNNSLTLQVPWLKLVTQVAIENPEILKQCLQNLGANNVAASDLLTISTVLESFSKYPVYYIAPAAKKGDVFQIVDESLLDKTLVQTLAQIAHLGKGTFEGIDVANMLAMQSAGSRKDWSAGV